MGGLEVMSGEVTIKNGKEIRKWVIFFIVLVGILITGITGWNSLSADVEDNCEMISEIELEGTKVSRKNRIDILLMKKDIEYTAIMTKKIADKLGVN